MCQQRPHFTENAEKDFTMQEKISLAGDLGSGKSTVSDILIKRLGAEYYSTGRIVREIAQRYGMDVKDFNIYMETHPEIDHEIDDGLRALSDVDKFLIIDSRMAWHFTNGTFKVYLSCDIEVAAARIMAANRDGEHSDTLEGTVAATRARRESEKKRYYEQYGEDITDFSNYSLILDTTYATPAEVAEALIAEFEAHSQKKPETAALICPERLYYADDGADVFEVEKLAQKLDSDEEIPPVSVYFENGNFYVAEGVESVLAYALNMAVHIPCVLVKKPDNVKKVNYVRMQNSL